MILKNNKTQKICIIILGLFGDVLFRTPILRSIKQKYPNSKITVIVDKIGYDILYNNPNVSKLIIMNRKKHNYASYIYSKIATQVKILLGRFDLVIDLYNGSSSRAMTKLALTKYIIVKDGGGDERGYPFTNQHHYSAKLFMGLSQLNLEKTSMDITPEFFINDDVKCKILKEFNGFKESNFYLLSLGSGGPNKILDIQKTYEIVKYLQERYGLKPMIVANPAQEFLQESLINDFLLPNGINHLKLSVRSIDEIAVIIKYSKFFIVPDTGLLHLSFSLKTPTFCVFTYTHPAYVQPENKEQIYGFAYKIKESQELDNFGLQRCTQEISFDEIRPNLDEFIAKALNV